MFICETPTRSAIVLTLGGRDRVDDCLQRASERSGEVGHRRLAAMGVVCW